jgi:eukaryotic translation initiation factor 2C
MEAHAYRVVTKREDGADLIKYDVPHHLPLRPGFNTAGGKDITIRVNQFKVLQWPQRDVFQYDVSQPHWILDDFMLTKSQVQIGNDAEKRGKIMAVWNSSAVQSKLRSLIQGPWLWDGNKIAWYVSASTLPM